MKKRFFIQIKTKDRLNDIINENKKLMGQIIIIRKERVHFLMIEQKLKDQIEYYE